MRIGLVVDSACDLPLDYLEEHGVVVLPTTVRIGDAVLADQRDPKATLQFLHAHVAEGGATAETTPFSVQQISETRSRPATPSSMTTAACARSAATTPRSHCG